MHISKFLLTATIASLAVLAAASAALATPVAATTGVNVRSGPGTDFNVLDTLGAGEFAEVVECVNSGWCRVEHSGPSGWVYNTYLGPRPGAGNQGGNQNGNQNGNPANPAQNDQIGACFYTGQGHTGQETCQGVGTYNTLGSFDNTIRSYKVFGGAHVNFCVEPNMTGSCFEGQRSTPTLGPPLDGKASSLSIFTIGAQPANNGFDNQGNAPQNNQQANNQGNNAPADDDDCSFSLVLGPEGPTFALTCGDNPIIPDQGQNNNNQGNNQGNNNDPVADAGDRFGDNEELIIVGEGENGNNDQENNNAAPDPTPQVKHIRRATINISFNADLDDGQDISSEAVDLWYEGVNDNLAYITPKNNAIIARANVIYPSSNYKQCRFANYNQSLQLRRGFAEPGTSFCVQTSEENYAKISIVSWDSSKLVLDIVTWDKN